MRNQRKEPSLGTPVGFTSVGFIAALLFICALYVPLRSDEPISSSVTFNREVIRIFERKCLPCHAPGAVAMSLANYREARLWARGIREELIEQRMPPWRAAPGYGAFANDIGLTLRELTMLLTWTDSGAPKGEDRDLPRRATVQREARVPPDHTVQLPPQRIPAGEEHVVRRVTIDADIAANRLIRPVQIVPGDTRVLRAAFISLEGAGNTPARWIGAWTPWLRSITTPDGAAFRVPAGARLAIELHYRGRDADAEDRSSLALFFAPDAAPIADQVVVDAQRGSQSTLRDPARIWAIFPELSADAAGSLEVSARKPDGSIEVLLWIPKRHDAWPTPYILQSPVLLPAGTTIKVTTSSPTRVTLATIAGLKARATYLPE